MGFCETNTVLLEGNNWNKKIAFFLLLWCEEMWFSLQRNVKCYRDPIHFRATVISHLSLRRRSRGVDRGGWRRAIAAPSDRRPAHRPAQAGYGSPRTIEK